MLERPASGSPTGRAPGGRPDLLGTRPIAAVIAAAWAAVVGLVGISVLVTIAWAITGRGDDGITTPFQAGGVIWLAGHHAPVDTVIAGKPGPAVTLLPMLVLIVLIALLVLASRWAVRIAAPRTTLDLVVVVVVGAATYSVLGLLVAQFASIAGATVSDVAAVVATGLVGLVGLGAGAVAFSDVGRALVTSLPDVVRRSALVTTTAGCALLAFAGVAAMGALITHWSAMAALSHRVAPGAGDEFGLLLMQLAFLPNLLVWAVAYVCGPGFGVGAGQSVDPFSASGGLLPAVPVLAAVPSPAPVLGPALLLLPVLAGVIAAVVLRRRVPDLELVEEVTALVVGAVLLGVLVEVLAALSGGALGNGRLVDLGPPAFVTGLAAGGLVGAGAVLYSLVKRLMPTVWVTDSDPATRGAGVRGRGSARRGEAEGRLLGP